LWHAVDAPAEYDSAYGGEYGGGYGPDVDCREQPCLLSEGDDAACNEAICEDGQCIVNSINDGGPCESNPDQCFEGSCMHGRCTNVRPISCTLPDEIDHVGCLEATCSNGVCGHNAINDGTGCSSNPGPCSDGVCSEGVCKDASEDPCTLPEGVDSQCNEPVCSDDGSCGHNAIDDGTGCSSNPGPCPDGVCSEGVCKDASEDPCTLPEVVDAQCNDPVCNEDGVCGYDQKLDGTTCDSNSDACYMGGCAAGACANKDLIECTLPDDVDTQCNAAVCEGGVCEPQPKNLDSDCTLEGSACAGKCVESSSGVGECQRQGASHFDPCVWQTHTPTPVWFCSRDPSNPDPSNLNFCSVASACKAC
jgi:hypothetical protein